MRIKKIFLSLVVLFFCLGIMRVQAKEVGLSLGWFEKNYDPVIFSQAYTFLLGMGTEITFAELRTNPEEYEGVGHGIFGDHLVLGFGLHLVGYIGKKTDYFQFLPPKVKCLSRLGHFLVWEDVYQHLVMQRHDNYGPGKSGEEYAIGYVQKFYRYILHKDRNDEVFLVLVELARYKNFALGFGHYQGPCVFFNAEVSNLGQCKINMTSLLVGKHHMSKELVPEQMIFGMLVEVDWGLTISPTVFAGCRILEKRQNLNSPWAVGVGIKF